MSISTDTEINIKKSIHNNQWVQFPLHLLPARIQYPGPWLVSDPIDMQGTPSCPAANDPAHCLEVLGAVHCLRLEPFNSSVISLMALGLSSLSPFSAGVSSLPARIEASPTPSIHRDLISWAPVSCREPPADLLSLSPAHSLTTELSRKPAINILAVFYKMT